MSRAEPLITSEELQCLLGGVPVRPNPTGRGLRPSASWLHFGAALWLVKGVFLYAVLMSPEAAPLMTSNRYLGLRASLEFLCLSAFWSAALHPRGHTTVRASVLVAGTTLLMDLLVLLALAP